MRQTTAATATCINSHRELLYFITFMSRRLFASRRYSLWIVARPPVRRTGRLYHKVTPQKFFAAPVDRPLVFPPRAQLLSRSMVYSSSRRCSPPFSAVVSYSLLSSRVLPATLTVRFCQLRSLRSLPAFLFFFLFIVLLTLRHTHFLFPSLFPRQFQLGSLILLISYIYSSDTYVYTR